MQASKKAKSALKEKYATTFMKLGRRRGGCGSKSEGLGLVLVFDKKCHRPKVKIDRENAPDLDL